MLLVTCKSKQHFNILASSLHDMYNNTDTHTGSAVARDTKDRAVRLHLPSTVKSQLGRKHHNNHNVSIRVKGKIYRAIILSTLQYGAETWTVYRRHVKKLYAFMMRHMRSIMKIRWQDKVRNIKVLKRAGLPSMEDLHIRKNLRWTGHLLRMPTDRLVALLMDMLVLCVAC